MIRNCCHFIQAVRTGKGNQARCPALCKGSFFYSSRWPCDSPQRTTQLKSEETVSAWLHTPSSLSCTRMGGGLPVFQMLWMGAGAAGLPGARVMLLIRDPEPGNATTLPPNKEGNPVRGRSGKRSTAHFQSWRTSKDGDGECLVSYG